MSPYLKTRDWLYERCLASTLSIVLCFLQLPQKDIKSEMASVVLNSQEIKNDFNLQMVN